MESWNNGFVFIIPSFHRSITLYGERRIEAPISQIDGGNGTHSLKGLPSPQVVQE
jgi:hypothetical protein